MMFSPMSKTELTILVGAVVIVAGLALRGAWEYAQDAAQIARPFMIWIDAAGR